MYNPHKYAYLIINVVKQSISPVELPLLVTGLGHPEMQHLVQLIFCLGWRVGDDERWLLLPSANWLWPTIVGFSPWCCMDCLPATYSFIISRSCVWPRDEAGFQWYQQCTFEFRHCTSSCWLLSVRTCVHDWSRKRPCQLFTIGTLFLCSFFCSSLGESYWEKCGLKVPTLCTTVSLHTESTSFCMIRIYYNYDYCIKLLLCSDKSSGLSQAPNELKLCADADI